MKSAESLLDECLKHCGASRMYTKEQWPKNGALRDASCACTGITECMSYSNSLNAVVCYEACKGGASYTHVLQFID